MIRQEALPQNPLSFLFMAHGLRHLSCYFYPTVSFCHARYIFTMISISKMRPTLWQKPIIIPLSSSDKSHRFCITRENIFCIFTIYFIYHLNQITHDFCYFVFNVDFKNRKWLHIFESNVCFEMYISIPLLM